VSFTAKAEQVAEQAEHANTSRAMDAARAGEAARRIAEMEVVAQMEACHEAVAMVTRLHGCASRLQQLSDSLPLSRKSLRCLWRSPEAMAVRDVARSLMNALHGVPNVCRAAAGADAIPCLMMLLPTNLGGPVTSSYAATALSNLLEGNHLYGAPSGSSGSQLLDRHAHKRRALALAAGAVPTLITLLPINDENRNLGDALPASSQAARGLKLLTYFDHTAVTYAISEARAIPLILALIARGSREEMWEGSDLLRDLIEGSAFLHQSLVSETGALTLLLDRMAALSKQMREEKELLIAYNLAACLYAISQDSPATRNEVVRKPFLQSLARMISHEISAGDQGLLRRVAKISAMHLSDVLHWDGARFWDSGGLSTLAALLARPKAPSDATEGAVLVLLTALNLADERAVHTIASQIMAAMCQHKVRLEAFPKLQSVLQPFAREKLVEVLVSVESATLFLVSGEKQALRTALEFTAATGLPDTSEMTSSSWELLAQAEEAKSLQKQRNRQLKAIIDKGTLPAQPVRHSLGTEAADMELLAAAESKEKDARRRARALAERFRCGGVKAEPAESIPGPSHVAPKPRDKKELSPHQQVERLQWQESKEERAAQSQLKQQEEPRV
jgi:hypothetical protein